MQEILDELSKLQLHPVADHFTISLLMVAVVVDLVATAAPTRHWLRYMALTLIVLGALAAGASFYTGGWEADRVWDAVTGPGKAVLERHADLGEYLTVAFAVLAIWRIAIESLALLARTRSVYLVVAVVAVLTLGYQGHLGGKLVYDYGVGTALMPATPGASPTPAAGPSPAAVLPTPAGPLPTVYNPPATPEQPQTPGATPSRTPAAAPSSTPTSAGGNV